MHESLVDEGKFHTFIEINSLINSDYSDPQVLLQRILESATRLTNGEASSILLLNPENNRLYFEVALGTKSGEIKNYSLALGEGIAGWVAEHNRSLIVDDVEEDKRFFSEISQKIGFETTSILAVPMRLKDACIGVIELINKRGGGYFDQSDLRWLEIFANQAALAIQNARSYHKARNEIESLSDRVSMESGFHELVATSAVMMEKLQLVERIARTDSSVLILGESGVGKELFAEQLHLKSPRASMPLIRVNCAALPGDLLESELFGHVKGAFTDADSDRRGRFELADGGTIFLDEIAELPLGLQAKMLRVLQQKTFERLGSSEPVTVDVRIVAATNRDIETLVSEGSFRKDLYYRLNVLPLRVPPLRERPDDVRALGEHFLKRFARDMNKQVRGFTSAAMEAMQQYTWPGNVRELENAIERAVVVGEGEYIDEDDLVFTTRSGFQHESYVGKTLKDSVNQFKKQLIQSTLQRNNWNQTASAKELDIQRTYLSRLIRELDIAR